LIRQSEKWKFPSEIRSRIFLTAISLENTQNLEQKFPETSFFSKISPKFIYGAIFSAISICVDSQAFRSFAFRFPPSAAPANRNLTVCRATENADFFVDFEHQEVLIRKQDLGR
jgi:hypothetical protein